MLKLLDESLKVNRLFTHTQKNLLKLLSNYKMEDIIL